MIVSRVRFLGATIVLGASALLSGCGDSSGPGSVDAEGALQSLALGLQDAGLGGSPGTPGVSGSLAGIAPLLTKTTVTIDGSPQEMFALGARQTFPEGTCEEDIFVDPAFPDDPTTCFSIVPGLTLFFWQSHSADEPPDRLLFVTAGPGTVSFDDLGTGEFDASTLPSDLPAFAFYLQPGRNDFWASLSGTLTSQITSLNQSCGIQLPPYAKSGSCSFATFDEEGRIVFEQFTLDGPGTRRLTIEIPRQSVSGLWLDITEVQPIAFPLMQNGVAPKFSIERLARAARQVTRAR